MELIAASENFLSLSTQLCSSSANLEAPQAPQAPHVLPVAPGLTSAVNAPSPVEPPKERGKSSSLTPELALGQCMGAMLRHKPLPTGVNLTEMPLLACHVKQLIPRLTRGGERASISAISAALRRLGMRAALIKAVINLAYFYSNSFCFWVPLEGEVGISLLDTPLPPLDDKVQAQLLSVLAQRMKARLRGPVPKEQPISAFGVWTGKAPPLCQFRGAADQSGKTLAEQSAKTLAEELEKEGLTTLMIKNLPTHLAQPVVLEEVDSGFAGRYDFFYLPGTFTYHKSFGYAFVNLVDVPTMKEFTLQWHNSMRLGSEPLKICGADVQGREANVENFGPRMKRIRNPCLRPVIRSPDTEVQA
ncbi:unnamed protein product [Effrenium voratum]|nr:unnamed protein product [Effrenium voratum]